MDQIGKSVSVVGAESVALKTDLHKNNSSSSFGEKGMRVRAMMKVTAAVRASAESSRPKSVLRQLSRAFWMFMIC